MNSEVARNAQYDCGFTLVEMLVALALLSLMTAMLVGSIRNARTALALVERDNTVTSVIAAQGYLRSALLQARVKPRSGITDTGILSFTGDGESMSFLSSYAPRSQFDGVYRITIGLAPSTSGGSHYNLVATQAVYRPQASEKQAPPARLSAILLENVRAVAFSYYGAQGSQNGPIWQDNWSQLFDLPLLVAIDVQFARGDGRVWHRLQVPLYASDSQVAPCPPRVSCL